MALFWQIDHFLISLFFQQKFQYLTSNNRAKTVLYVPYIAFFSSSFFAHKIIRSHIANQEWRRKRRRRIKTTKRNTNSNELLMILQALLLSFKTDIDNWYSKRQINQKNVNRISFLLPSLPKKKVAIKLIQSSHNNI